MGYLSDMTDDVSVITAEYLNGLRDQGTATFDTEAARDLAITAPETGQPVYVYSGDADEGPMWQTSAGDFRKAWNTAWGVLLNPDSTTVDTTATTSYVDSALSITTGTIPANRWIMWELTAHVYSSIAGDVGSVALRDSTGTVIGYADVVCAVANFATAISWRWLEASSGAALTRKVSVKRSFGTGTIHLFADAQRPAILSVADMGPSGAPA